jgi:hypothetical protein
MSVILAVTLAPPGSPSTYPTSWPRPNPAWRGYGLGGRLRLAAGDFFAAVPEGADTYLLSMVLRD